MVLRGGEVHLRSGLAQLESRPVPGLVGVAQQIRVESGAGADPARAAASIAQGHRHRRLGLAGNDPHRRQDDGIAISKLDLILVGEPEPLRELRTHQRGVVPGQFGQGLGQLLQPAVVRKAPIPDRRVGGKDKIEFRAVGGRRSRLAQEIRSDRRRPHRQLRSFERTAAQRLIPERVDLGLAGWPWSRSRARSGSRSKQYCPSRSANSSCADLPPYSGAIRGCCRATVPSKARVSDQLSRKCACGICQSQSAEVSSS